MKVLVVYDTVSPMKLTEKVAETISRVLKEEGKEVDSFFVTHLDASIITNYDCALVGAPTMAFRASNRIRQFFNQFTRNEFSGKLAAAFGTQVQSWWSGSAAKGIEGKLRKLGFKLVTTPLVIYVAGKRNEMRLKEGELEKVITWAQTVAEALPKKRSF